MNARIQSKNDTTANWNAARGFVPLKGEVIIYTDYKTITLPDEGEGEQVVNVPGIKIGDGNAYVQDLPFMDDALGNLVSSHINNPDIHVTSQEKEFWGNKVNVDDVNDLLYDELINETLVLNRN